MTPPPHHRRHAHVPLTAAVLAASAGAALADTLTWTGSAAGNTWSDPSNWLNSAGAPTTPDLNAPNSIFFTGSPPIVTTNNDLNSLTVNGLTFVAGATGFT